MKNINKKIIELVGEDEPIILADGFESAFIGVAHQFTTAFAVYDRKKRIEILMKDMTSEEAEEYFEFNVQGAYVGENTPAFLIK
jgi:hypothetical protein